MKQYDLNLFRYLILLLVTCLFFLEGCASLPDLEKITALESAKKPAENTGPEKPFSQSRTKAKITELKEEAGPTQILDQHIQLVEKISGSSLIEGNKVTLLRDGPETLKAIYKAIRKAENHIHLEIFIFKDDNVGRPLANLLIKKQLEGVQVRLIYDGFGSRNTPDCFFDRMRQAGIEVYEFNPFSFLDLFGKWTFNHRDHRKILVVDGEVAFIGGINLYEVYAKDPFSERGNEQNGKIYWRDTQIKVEGPAVAELQKLFLQIWRLREENFIKQPDFFPPLAKKGDLLVRIISSTHRQPIPAIYATYLSAVMNAGRSIYITQAYFIPNDDILEALCGAAQRGVEVKIILPGNIDFWMPQYAGRFHYAKLLKCGVKIYEMNGANLHSKSAVIDSVWSTVGSSNMNTRSFLHDAEANTVILSHDFAKKMEAAFKTDLSKSKQMILEKWEKRGWLNRLGEGIAVFFDYWL